MSMIEECTSFVAGQPTNQDLRQWQYSPLPPKREISLDGARSAPKPSPCHPPLPITGF